jgi:hypothetical protein
MSRGSVSLPRSTRPSGTSTKTCAGCCRQEWQRRVPPFFFSSRRSGVEFVWVSAPSRRFVCPAGFFASLRMIIGCCQSALLSRFNKSVGRDMVGRSVPRRAAAHRGQFAHLGRTARLLYFFQPLSWSDWRRSYFFLAGFAGAGLDAPVEASSGFRPKPHENGVFSFSMPPRRTP